MNTPEDSRTTTERAPRITRVALAAIVLVAVALLASVAAALPSAPPKCAVCHTVARYDATAASRAHDSVSCESCHAPRAPLGGTQLRLQVVTSMLPSKLLGRGASGPRSEVSRAACLSCHAAVMNRVTASAGLKINHATCAPVGGCDRCHAEAGHAVTDATWHRQPVMADCVACHKRTGASVACNTCHENKPLQAAIIRGPWQIMHGPNWKTLHGQGDLTTCSTCHQSKDCVKCHTVQIPHPANWRSAHGAAALKGTSACYVCHAGGQICQTCHGIQMPHPADFMSKHPKIATGVNDPVCSTCHTPADCTSCHEKHVHPGWSNGGYPSPNSHVTLPPFSKGSGGK